MKKAAKRMASQTSKSFGMYETAAALEAARPEADIIHLEIGRPSADTPVHIKEAAKDALDRGVVHYGELAGSGALREAVARRYREDSGVDVSAAEVLITNGVTQASFAAFMTLIEEGDEVIVLDPYYPQHNSKVELMGGRVVTAPLDTDRNFRFDPEAFEKVITPASTMVILVNPNNPTGTIFSREELMELRELAIKHDLWVLADEVYEYNMFDDNRHISMASLPDMKERTITVSAFTKGYAMDGWRIGYAAASEDMIRKMNRITKNDTTHPCVFAQEGALAAVQASQDCVAELVRADQERRDLVVKRLNGMPGIRCTPPQATMYAFADFRACNMPAVDLAKDILHETHVALEAGSFYGKQGEGFLRICFSADSPERLEEAMDRLDAYFSGRAAKHPASAEA